jgi:hypothetical protein
MKKFEYSLDDVDALLSYLDGVDAFIESLKANYEIV